MGVILLIVNVLISLWNTYAVGTAWKDTMAFGNKFDKALLWSGVIQAGVGFSMPILIGLAYVAVSIATSGDAPKFTPEEGQQLLQGIFSLWYLAVIFPILGSGLAIWLHSLRLAFKRKDFTSIAVLGWNTVAQVSNTISAINNIGKAFGDIKGMFKFDNKGGLAAIAVPVVLAALAGGFFVAFALVRYFANKTESRLEEYAEKELAK